MDLKLQVPHWPPSHLLDHLLMWGIAAATVVLFAASGDFYRGKAEIGDAIPFTAAFLATGYFLFGSHWIGRCTDGTRLAGLVLPSFMVLVMAYFVLAGRAGFIQPGATAAAVLAQILSLVVVCVRNQ
jgi:hypothetical protein